MWGLELRELQGHGIQLSASWRVRARVWGWQPLAAIITTRVPHRKASVHPEAFSSSGMRLFSRRVLFYLPNETAVSSPICSCDIRSVILRGSHGRNLNGWDSDVIRTEMHPEHSVHTISDGRRAPAWCPGRGLSLGGERGRRRRRVAARCCDPLGSSPIKASSSLPRLPRRKSAWRRRPWT